MKKTTSPHALKLAILGVALAASGAAFAASSEAPQRFHDRGHHGAHHHGHHGHYGHQGHHGVHGAAHHGGKRAHGHRHAHMHRAGLVVPGYGIVSQDFVDGMGLNENQLKLIQEARTAAKDLRQNRRDSLKSMRDARKERLSAAFDPEQALKQADEQREKFSSERRQIDEKWVAVWKSLDQGQQERVAAHMNDRAEKAEKRAEKREERREKRDAARAAERASKSST